MLGAIIGDVAGSTIEVLEVNDKKKKGIRDYQERIKILDSRTKLFDSESSVTDDSILTVAILDAVLNNRSYETTLREYGLREIKLGVDKYGRSRFGRGFISWLKGESNGVSFGNGCAMRISPIGFLFDSLEEVVDEARLSTIPTHNNPDSIKCATAVATSIFLLRCGISKLELISYIKNNYFDLDYDLEYLQHNYKFTSSAIDSVPQAIFCFMKSDSFENAIRTSLSIGGDADTIACITGSLAEAYYGVPEYLKEEVIKYIPDYMKEILSIYYKKEKVLCKK